MTSAQVVDVETSVNLKNGPKGNSAWVLFPRDPFEVEEKQHRQTGLMNLNWFLNKQARQKPSWSVSWEKHSQAIQSISYDKKFSNIKMLRLNWLKPHCLQVETYIFCSGAPPNALQTDTANEKT